MSREAKATFAFLKYMDLLQNGQQDQAQAALRQAIDLDPSPGLYLEQISTLWQADQIQSALEASRQARRAFPDSQDLAVIQARLYQAMDRTDQAVEVLQDFLRTTPGDIEIRSQLARVFMKNKEHGQALDVLKAIPEAKRDASIHYLLAQAYTSMEDRAKTISHLKQATEQNPTFIKAWAELAYQYELGKNYSEAVKAYSRLLDLNSANQEILSRIILLNLKLNNPQKALQVARTAMQDPSFQLHAVGLFLQNDFHQQARELLQSVEAPASSSDRSQFYRAILAYQADKDLAQALAHLEQIQPESQLYSRSLALRCQLLFELDRGDETLELCRKGQELFPEQQDFWLLEAEIHISDDDLDKAREALLKGLDHQGDSTSLLFQLGVVEHEQGLVNQALEHMEKVINIDPDHAAALNFIGYTLAEQGQNLDRAEILIKKALNLDPENGYYLDSLAWLYFKSGKLDQAWEAISNAVSRVKDDPIIWEHYGDIASAVQKPDQARTGYERALEHGPDNPEQIRDKLRSILSGESSSFPPDGRVLPRGCVFAC
jgi:tetratricopeptide (TPR) repeat protein